MKKVKPQLREVVADGFPILAIGASAGGFETFSSLLQVLPVDTGIAYILVSPLDPRHKSTVAESLSQSTSMHLQEAKEGMRIEPNHIYIISPDTNMIIVNRVLKLVLRVETLVSATPLSRPHSDFSSVDMAIYLRSIIKEQDTMNEELRAANEELQSINEELQHRNEQLKHARDYSQAIVETIREPLVILDASLHVQSANSAFYKTFQVSRKDVEGEFLYSLGNGQWNIPKLQKQLHEILSKRTKFKNFEVAHTFPIIGRKVLLLNARQIDHLALVLLAMEDVTGRKAIERHREIDRQKDEFIGIVSHELKTPVTSIKAFTQVLQNRFIKAGDDKSAMLLMKMDTQLDKLTGLITDLLDVTKIETGKLQFHNGYFDFNEVITGIVEEMQRTTERHTINKKLAKTKSIYGDKDRIGQVLVNLLTNAIKYSPQSNKIIVKTEITKEEVLLCVQDFGVGIPTKSQKKVFERFFRVTGKKEATFPGMGLGLYISAEIIKRHNGKIWVESTEGNGSMFCFSIPITHPKRAQTPSAGENSSA